ncbi:MAG: hypothetical protein FJ098_12360, partial [Deltaproteobacteria bacterium]|nr:hypothetical protein [Deltaproteobacteria bacterium]
MAVLGSLFGGGGASTYGRPRLRLRLWRLRLPHGLVVMAPLLLLCLWYAGAAVLSHVRYARALGGDHPLTLENFHLHLHDHLTRDLRRLTAPPPDRAGLPVMNLHLTNADLDSLERNLPPGEGDAEYVSGFLQKGNDIWRVGVRYRGRRHWQWNHAQKS